MFVNEMLDSLALRLEDPTKRKYPDRYKLRALENGQVFVAQLLNDAYLTELEKTDSNKAVSSGAVSFSNLSNEILRGGEGIKTVKNHGGLYCALINWRQLKRNENSYLAGSTRNPMAYKFANAIRILPTTLTALDISYLKMPSPLIHPFTIAAAGTPSPTEFVFDADQNVSASDDYYSDNGAVIYMTGSSNNYKIITDYVGTTRTVTVDPAEAGSLGAAHGPVYFVPTKNHDFQLTNLSAVTCDLDPSLHDLVVLFAEVECWKMARELTRAKSALEKVIDTIKTLNDRYEAPGGVGTRGRS